MDGEFLCNLAAAHWHRNEFDECEKALMLAKNMGFYSPKLHNNLGFLYSSRKQYPQALAEFRAANEPYNYALTQLEIGQWEEGFKGFSQTSKSGDWNGQDLTNKTIRVWPEGGFGDKIWVTRYFDWIKQKWPSATVNFPTDNTTWSLLQRCHLLRYSELFDYEVAMFDLPRIHGTTLDNVPPDQGLIRNQTRTYYRPKHNFKRVGYCCSGDPKYIRSRDIPVEMITSLASDKLRLFNLKAWDSLLWMFTAEFMMGLDLVITIDTSIAHLAGALNIPTYVLLTYDSAWYWLQDRSDCVWYPSLKLIRQPKKGDWTSVIKELECHLKTM